MDIYLYDCVHCMSEKRGILLGRRAWIVVGRRHFVKYFVKGLCEGRVIEGRVIEEDVSQYLHVFWSQDSKS